MQKFYHNNISKLKTLQLSINLVLQKYNARDYDTDRFLLELLNTAVINYKELGNTDRESQTLALKAEFLTAQRGINPITFQKITIRRNEMTNTIAFKIIQAIELLIRNDLQELEQKILQAKEIVTQIVIAGLQAAIITPIKIKAIKGQKQIEGIWRSLSADPNIALGQSRVLLQVSKYDVWVILDEALASLK